MPRASVACSAWPVDCYDLLLPGRKGEVHECSGLRRTSFTSFQTGDAFHFDVVGVQLRAYCYGSVAVFFRNLIFFCCIRILFVYVSELKVF